MRSMMTTTTFTCDRCGEATVLQAKKAPTLTATLHGQMIPSGGALFTGRGDGYKIEICEDCIISLDAWMKTGKES